MMRVLCIFVETTVPVRIRPRIETMPVKGHFLSKGPRLDVSPELKASLEDDAYRYRSLRSRSWVS